MREKCVLCGAETVYEESDSIATRFFYVRGCGQLCQSCYSKTYVEHEPWLAWGKEFALIKEKTDEERTVKKVDND